MTLLKGVRPADLSAQLPTKTAKALGLGVPTTLLYRADDVIE
jgi:hypothetical protein